MPTRSRYSLGSREQVLPVEIHLSSLFLKETGNISSALRDLKRETTAGISIDIGQTVLQLLQREQYHSQGAFKASSCCSARIICINMQGSMPALPETAQTLLQEPQPRHVSRDELPTCPLTKSRRRPCLLPASMVSLIAFPALGPPFLYR